MNRIALALVAAVMALGAVVAQEPDQEKKSPWLADFDKAVAQAKDAKKDLFVDFTGSDWCGWCKRLDKEVFQFDTFLTAATKEYVLVALDFPRSEEVKAKVPSPERNQALMEKYGVQGFPTILLMSADGEVFARTGYQEGGPDKYVEHLKEIREKGKASLAEIKKLCGDYDAAAAKAKPALVEQAAAKLESLGEDGVGAESLVKIVRDAFNLDPENKAGLKLKAVKALLKAGKAEDGDRTAAKEMDPKNEQGLLEQVVFAQVATVRDEETCRAAIKAISDLDALGPLKDKQLAIQMFARAAMWSQRNLNNAEDAKKFAKKAKDLNPDNERLVKMLDEILGG